MAAVAVADAGTASTANTNTYASASFTPVAGDLLVVFSDVSSSSGPSCIASANGITFTRVTTGLINAGTADWLSATSVNLGWVWVANQLVGASPVAMTVTVAVSGGNGTGADIAVARVSGITKTGLGAIRQAAHTDNTGTGTTPNVVFGAACLTENPVLVGVSNATNPATMTPPTNFTERGDVGFATPTHGFEWATRDSGHTSATVTWGGASGSQWGAAGVEITTATPVTATVATSWAVRSAVTAATVATSWAVRSAVAAATLATSWAVRAAVAQAVATSWAVRSAVAASTLASSWAVRSAVAAATVASSWAVRAAVSQTLATSWAVRAAITKSLGSTWAVRSSVAASTVATAWAVRAAIAKTLASTWAVRAPVTQTLATTWNVDSISSVTSNPLATSWAVRSQVTRTLGSTWAVRAGVTSSLGASTWAVRSIVAPSSRATTWAVRGTAAGSVATAWAVVAPLGSSALSATQWAVLSRVPVSTRSTTWKVRFGPPRDLRVTARPVALRWRATTVSGRLRAGPVQLSQED